MKTVKLSLATIQGKLSRAEMKKIMAGSGGGGSLICAAVPSWEASLSGHADCFPDAATAELYAGANGWWCCNCQEAIAACS